MARRLSLIAAIAGHLSLLAVLSPDSATAAPEAATPPSVTTRPCGSGLVAMTFDDGPSPTYTPRLLRVLEERHAPATFFVVGQRIVGNEHMLRRMHRDRFVVGNHSWSHPFLTSLSSAGIRAQIRRTQRAIRHAGVPRPTLMRPPYGATNSRVAAVITSRGLVQQLWDIDPRDWDHRGAGEITRAVLGALSPGNSNVIVMHDGVSNAGKTVAAVPRIIRGVRERGFCLTTLNPRGGMTDPRPTLRVRATDVTERDPGQPTRARVRLELSTPTWHPVRVQLTSSGGDAEPGADYDRLSETLTIPAGARARTLSVIVHGDRVDEPRERFGVTARQVRGAHVVARRAVVTIRDDDPLPQIRLHDRRVQQSPETEVTVHVPLRLNRPSEFGVKVHVLTRDGSATAESGDYTPVDTWVTYRPGRVRLSIPVRIGRAELVEDDETFTVRAVRAHHGIIELPKATVTITAALLRWAPRH